MLRKKTESIAKELSSAFNNTSCIFDRLVGKYNSQITIPVNLKIFFVVRIDRCQNFMAKMNFKMRVEKHAPMHNNAPKFHTFDFLTFGLTVFFFPYLYLKDESARVEDQPHLKNVDKLAKREKLPSTFSTPCMQAVLFLDTLCCYRPARGVLGKCHVNLISLA